MWKIRLLLVLAATVPSFGTTVYVSASDANLYTIDPTTGATTLIGSTTVPMADIAVLNGEMFGVSFPASGDSFLYSIDPTTGAATEIGDTGLFLNALQFAPDGTLYAAGGSPGCGPPPQAACNSFVTINTTTGLASLVGTGGYESAGDLEFVGSTLYLTSRTSTTDSLYTVTPGNGAASLVGDIGFSQVFGLAYIPETGTLYGFDDVGNDVLSINPSTGAGTKVETYSSNFEIYGSATSTVPEPRETAAALGFALLAGIAIRNRRKRSLTWPALGGNNKVA